MSILTGLSGRLRPLNGLLHIFLAAPCQLCGAASPGAICPTCQKHLRRCRLSSKLGASPALPVFAWGSYHGHLRQAIAALKYQQKPEIADFLGAELVSLWPKCDFPAPTVVPIPLHSDRLQQRGFNQAERLAQSFCRATGLGHCPQGLIRIRATAAQHSLSARQRQQNLERAFAIGSGLAPGKPVLLLDDIYTSGATAQAAAKTLNQRGIRVVGIVVVARALPSGPNGLGPLAPSGS